MSKVCENCNKKVLRKRSKFCSKACTYEKRYPNTKLTSARCANCDKNFEHLDIPSQNPKYCSIQCVGESNRKYPSRAWKRAVRKDKCEVCDFVPVHIGQLDLDHIDGNKLNNSEENLQTLCANCHRLKTILNRDHLRATYNGEGSEL